MNLASISLSFRRFEKSGAVEARLRELGEHMRRANPRITKCHISVHGGADQKAPVGLKIHLSLPDAQIHAEAHTEREPTLTDLFRALQEAHDDVRRQLRELQRDPLSLRSVSEC